MLCYFQVNSEGPKLSVSHSVVSDSLRPRGRQHASPPCPSPPLRVCSYSCPLSQRCHPTTSSSVTPLSSCLPSFPASGSFLMSWLFTSGGQSIAVSASASVLPMTTQGIQPYTCIYPFSPNSPPIQTATQH